MTADQFYAALEQKTRETGTTWTIQRSPFTEELLIRTTAIDSERGHCPLSFVAGTEPCNMSDARIALGMGRDEAWPIVTAADSEHGRMRGRLLKACGLTDGH